MNQLDLKLNVDLKEVNILNVEGGAVNVGMNAVQRRKSVSTYTENPSPESGASKTKKVANGESKNGRI